MDPLLRTVKLGSLAEVEATLPFAGAKALGPALGAALSQGRAEVALRIIARLPRDFDASSFLISDALDTGAEVVRALIPLSSATARSRLLFRAALACTEVVPDLAAASDVAPVLIALLEYRWLGKDDVAPPAYFAAADVLLPFVSAAVAQDILARHPGLGTYPNASAVLHHAALDAAVPSAAPPRQRI